MYQLGKKLGSGSEGDVYELLINLKQTNKIVKFSNNINFLEGYVLRNINHPNLMGSSMIEITSSGLIKKVQNKAISDLSEYIFQNNLSYIKKIKIIKQIIEGVAKLHSMNLIHCDIKPHNILIFDSQKIKLTDFGLLRLETSDSISRPERNVYTFLYKPPEAIRHEKITNKSDIFALGCTIYEILYSTPYFKEDKKKRYHLEIAQETEAKYAKMNSLIKKMVSEDPDQRPSIFELCREKIFRIKGYNPSEIFSIKYHKEKIKTGCQKKLIRKNSGVYKKVLYHNDTEDINLNTKLIDIDFDIFGYL